MAIEAGWDPEQGPPLPCPIFEDPHEPPWRPLDDAELGWFADLDRACPVDEDCPWPDDEPDPAPEPAWAVPGVTEQPPAPDEGLSAQSRAVLAEVAAAVRAQRLAGARVYRSIAALRGSDVLAETGYRRLGRLLEDHVHLDPTTVARLDRHTSALSETHTPTGATTPADLPATADAVADGHVDDRHVEVIAKTMNRLRKAPALDDSVLGVAEEQLAGLAAARSPRQLAAAAKVIADRLDPDGAAPSGDGPAGNELRYTRRRNGHLHAKLVLRDPAAAVLFDDAVHAATPPPASAVCADPDTGLPPVTDDGRDVGIDPRCEARDSKPARQAHGLLDLIAASHRSGLDHTEDEQHPHSPTASMPIPDLDDPTDTAPWTGDDWTGDDLPGNTTPTHHNDADNANDAREDSEQAGEESEPPLFAPGPPDPEAHHRPWTPPDPETMAHPGREQVVLTVTLDYTTLRQQITDTSPALALLGDSTWIRPDTARRLACDAQIIPMVLGTKGEVLDVGRRTRTIPTATARAVTHRDRHCAFPGCRRKARNSDIHHIQHWADLGDTEPDNLVCLCKYHHDLVHHSGWDVEMIDHQPWFRPPHWLDPTRTLRHNRPWRQE